MSESSDMNAISPVWVLILGHLGSYQYVPKAFKNLKGGSLKIFPKYD